MSFEHIPKFVWWPIAVFIGIGCFFMIELMILSWKAKSVEINLTQQAITIKNVDEGIRKAQTIISDTAKSIDRVTSQHQECADIGSQPNKIEGSCCEKLISKIGQASKFLNMQKQNLEIINNDLTKLNNKLHLKN